VTSLEEQAVAVPPRVDLPSAARFADRDRESRGIVENLVGYAKADLIVPPAPFADLAAANREAAAWCAEVNGVVHSEICAVPAERMLTERELLGPAALAAGQHRQ
jgi:hypothetical protein